MNQKSQHRIHDLTDNLLSITQHREDENMSTGRASKRAGILTLLPARPSPRTAVYNRWWRTCQAADTSIRHLSSWRSTAVLMRLRTSSVVIET